MRCVAIRHEEFEDLGTLEPVLRRRGWEVAYVDSFRSAGVEAAAGDPDLLVILGGPMGVYEADRHSFLKQEIRLCAGRLRRDRPTLGICLGSQIIAAALGARVYPGALAEIGWYPVTLEKEAASDPPVACLAAESDMFLHWHGDTFDLPAGAVLLARSRRTRHQGFRFGANGYALQFHLEVAPESIRRWTAKLARQLEVTPGAQRAGEIEEGAVLHGAAMARQARAFLESWLDRLRPGDPEKLPPHPS
jgi:GMP synthase (glutamine-hydrolysing)